jgi:hypothetical protein
LAVNAHPEDKSCERVSVESINARHQLIAGSIAELSCARGDYRRRCNFES